MIYPKPEDRYSCDVFCQNFMEIEGRLEDLEKGGNVSIAVDSELSTESTNPVQNLVVTKRINQLVSEKVGVAGWTADKYLGTDENGNIVEKDAPSGEDIDLTGYAKTEDIPTTLPTPNKLTFTGAVTAEFDGSVAVTVKIPEGGSDVDLGEYYKKTETYSRDEIDNLLASIPTYADAEGVAF